jgi:hypothetical protein
MQHEWPHDGPKWTMAPNRGAIDFEKCLQERDLLVSAEGLEPSTP